MQHLKEIAADTLNIMEKGYYMNPDNIRIDISQEMERSTQNTRTYTPEELDRLSEVPLNRLHNNTTYRVINETTLNAARMLHDEGKPDPLCLNFASARNHGGGFISGAAAQEESIARASTLYSTLLTDTKYYATHRAMKSCVYTDHMIYSPAVAIFKYEDGSYMPAPIFGSFITAAAVNRGVVEKREPEMVPQIKNLMMLRTEKVLTLGALHQHQYMVLGAWGCGVFRNDPEMIAEIFAELLNGKFKGCFREVIFAVKTNTERMIAPFHSQFTIH